MTASYLDASALVKLTTPEAESEALRIYLAPLPPPLTSRLAQIEVARALLRRGVTLGTSSDPLSRALPNLAIVELGPAIAERAGRLEPAVLRSLDAIHLATALELGDALGALVTYDRRLADAARAVGLSVVEPA